MKSTTIPYEQTGYFSQIIIDYLNQHNTLQPFYHYPPELSSFEKAISDKSKEQIDRQALADILTKQYAGMQPHENVAKNIRAFKDENTFCIVTAHQLNIFTGPLYVIYKSITTINACIELKKQYPQYNFVPVFWLGTEDHDFEEINHVHLFGKTYTWTDHQGGACGRYQPHSLQTLIDELKPVYGESEQAAFIYDTFSKAYALDTLADAARYYLDILFGDKGLVVIDADSVELKKVCSGIIEDELLRQTSISLVEDTIARMAYPSQAQPREVNLFYLKDRIRERIIKTEEGFEINNTDIRFSGDEILTELDEHPEYFSPNVILRPLFQQKVLPSVAYVGGGGELAYWLQLKSLFDHFEVNFPVLLLRNSVLWIEENGYKKMQKLQLSQQDLFIQEDELIKKFISSKSGELISLEKEKKEIADILQAVMEKAITIDSSLDKAVLAEKQNLLNALDKMEAKLLKAEKTKSDTEVQHIKTLKQKLFPDAQLQERYDNFIPLYLKYGHTFFDTLYQYLQPFGNQFTIITPAE